MINVAVKAGGLVLSLKQEQPAVDPYTGCPHNTTPHYSNASYWCTACGAELHDPAKETR